MAFTKLSDPKRKQWYQLTVLLKGTIDATGVDRDRLAEIMKCAPCTVTRRFHDVGGLTLEDVTRLGRGLHIPIEDLRDAIRY